MGKLEKLIENSGIIPADRPAVLSTFENYYKKHRHKKGVGNVSFFDRYFAAYTELKKEDIEKKDLLVRALKRVSELTETSNHVGEGLGMCADFLGIPQGTIKQTKKLYNKELPKKTIDLWIRSLDHLEEREEGNPNFKSIRLGKYLRISKSCLLEYHPSQDFVLGQLAEKGQIYGLERLMFSLAKEQNLNKKEAEKYFDNLREVPSSARRKIEETRKEIRGSPEIDFEIYDLLVLKNNTDSSRIASASLIRDIVCSCGGSSKDILKSMGIMKEIIEKDSSLIEETLQDSTDVFLLGQSFERATPLLPSYLRVVKYIAGLKVPGSEKSAYTHLASGIFKDYYWKGRRISDIRGVQERCQKSIENISSLKDKGVALGLLDSSMKNLGRSARLKRSKYKLYLDILAGDIVEAVSKNKNKAYDFLGKLVGYGGQKNE